MLSRCTKEQWEIPKDLQRTLLPAATCTVNQLLEFRLPVQRTSTVFTQPDQYLSSDPINCFQFDVANIPTPPTSVVETLSRAALSADETDKPQSIRCPHALTQSGKHYPPWLLTLWSELARVMFIKERWDRAVQYLVKPDTDLRNGGLSEEKAEEVCQEIQALPWDSLVKGFEDQGRLFQLHTYCSRDWLSSIHINYMLDLLKSDLGLTVDVSTSIRHTYLTQQVLAAYYYGNETYLTSKSYRAIRELAQDLATGIQDKLGTVLNVDGNHWIALMVDFQTRRVYYGNSLGGAINEELRVAYNWWFSLHNENAFEWVPMKITKQQDTYSCGLLAINALAHILDSKQFDLMDPKAVDAERINILSRIIDRHKEKVRS
jgi:Ulp1 protease family, C-terminal catalytic domain